MSGPKKPVYRDRVVHVMAEQCSTCVLRPGNLMGLSPGRVRGMVKNEYGFACHQTLGHDQALCIAWIKKYGPGSPIIRLAMAMDVLVFDGKPKEGEEA
jgi:hypothetical protein